MKICLFNHCTENMANLTFLDALICFHFPFSLYLLSLFFTLFFIIYYFILPNFHIFVSGNKYNLVESNKQGYLVTTQPHYIHQLFALKPYAVRHPGVASGSAVLPALAYKPCDLLSSWKPTSIAQSRRHRAIRVEG